MNILKLEMLYFIVILKAVVCGKVELRHTKGGSNI